MTTVTLHKLHTGFVNVPGQWSLRAELADEGNGDYAKDFLVPEGYTIGETVGGEPAIFDAADKHVEIIMHSSGKPQLVGISREWPVLKDVMTGKDIRNARAKLGKMWGLDRPLHAAELARALRLTGRDPGRSVLDWEDEKTAVSGPVSVAIEMMLDGKKPPTLAEALR